MEKIGLLIDSTSLTRDDFNQFSFIKVAQLQVEVDGEVFQENQLSKNDMIKYINEGEKILTSQPTPAYFLSLYKEFFDEGYTKVISVLLSHGLSGTYQSAMLAKSMIDFNLEIDIHSPDSASFGIALGVKRLADIIQEGKTYLEVSNEYLTLFKEPIVSFTLGDLKNLLRGGRLNKIQAFVGKILRIKPVIEMINGKLDLVRKERSNNGCIKHFINKIDYHINKYEKIYLDIININMPEATNKLIAIVKEKYKNIEIHLTDNLSPVFYSHLGSKGFGIAILGE